VISRHAHWRVVIGKIIGNYGVGDKNNPKNEIDDELRRNSTDLSYENKVHGWFSVQFANKVQRTPYFDLDQYAGENQVKSYTTAK
jgi:hypothetical protein